MEETFHSNQLHSLSGEVLKQFPDICQRLNVPITRSDKSYHGPCPIHGGDKGNAFHMYYDGHTVSGNWYCQTRQCHEVFINTPIGFIRGVLSNKQGWVAEGDPTVSFRETLRWLEQFLGKDLGYYSAEEERDIFLSLSKIWSRERPGTESTVTSEMVRQGLEIPSPYFIERGYSPEVLNKYDIGNCYTPGKEMNQRAVVPVYDDTGKFLVGCSGRTIHGKCDDCGAFHGPRSRCPSEDFRHLYGKWKNSKSLDADTYLYNYWEAAPHILDGGVVVLVESPGNVWKLEQAGIHCSVGTFGAKLSSGQKDLLDRSGAFSIVVIGDPDEAGRKMNKKVVEACSSQYHVVPLELTFDVGDASVEKLQEMVIPAIDKARI
jgi:5S rRNA maturation endonuclease (ribonuclease M5)